MLLAAALCALLSFPTLANISRRYYSCGGVLRGAETRESYLARAGVTPYFNLADWMNRNLPDDAVILVVGDARGLYYSRPFFTNTVFDAPFLAKAARDGLDAGGMLKRLKEMGVTHLAVNGEEGLRSAADYRHYELGPDEWRRLDGFMRRAAEPMAILGLKTVYRLLDEPADRPIPAPPHLLFLFSTTGARFSQAVRREEWTSALSSADEALAQCPWSSFWKEQKALVISRLGRGSEALEWFKKAGAAGVLQVDGYREWIQLLEKRHERREAEIIRGTARRWYPTLF